jgi:hypothetical protein
MRILRNASARRAAARGEAVASGVHALESRLLFSSNLKTVLLPLRAPAPAVTASPTHSAAINNPHAQQAAAAASQKHQHGKKQPKIFMGPDYVADHAMAEDDGDNIQFTGAPSPSTPGILGTIEGLNFDTQASLSGFYNVPPDNSAAAGPNHVVDVINTDIQWFTKAGTQQNAQSLQSFFSSLSPQGSLFDPKVVFDTYSNRFLVVTLEVRNNGTASQNIAHVLLAVSQTSDPNSGWFFRSFNSNATISGHSCWMDYPGFAVDATAIYVTGNMFVMNSDSNPTVRGAYEGTRCLIVSKSGFYTGGAPTSAILQDPAGAAGIGGPSGAFTLQPATTYGTTPGTTGTFFVNSGWIDANNVDYLSVIRVDNPLAASPTFTNQFISLGDIANGTSVPSVPQKGTANNLDGGDMRTLSAVWRNNTLWATDDINPLAAYDPTNAGQETAHWYKINTTTLGSLSLSDQGDIGGEDVGAGDATFYPSIAVDSAGNAAIDFSVAGPNTYPSAAYTVHTTSDATGTVEPSVVFAAGTDFYFREFAAQGGTRNRWGDYSAMVIDPAGTTFWAFNQYAITRGDAGLGGNSSTEDGRWGTRYASFAVVTTGSISGTLFQDNLSDGALNGSDVGLPGQTVFLDVNNNGLPDDGAAFVATTGAGGTFTFPSVPGGTYNLKEVVPSGYVESAPVGNAYSVNVTAGAALTGYTFPNFPITFTGTSGNDNYAVQLDAAGTNFQVLIGASLTYQAPNALFGSLPAAMSFSLLGGDDTLIINGANGGNPVPASPGISFDGGTHSIGDTLSVIGTSGNDTFVVSSAAVTFGANPISYTNTETVLLDPKAGSDSLTVNSGTVHLPAQTPGGGILNRHFSNLTINGTGVAIVNATGVQTDRSALQIDSLTLGAGSPLLDITNNEATINLALGLVTPLIYHQIISSSMTSNTSFAIGSNAITDSQTRIRFTLLGDTNLDGQVNVGDLANLAGNFGVTAGATWIQGDFDYNGTVDVADLADLAGSFGGALT